MGEIPTRSSEMVSPQCRQIGVDGDGGSEVIEQFWRFESFGSRLEQKEFLTEREGLALSTLNRTIRNVGDRYEIGLPWRSKTVQLPNNRASALRRLFATECRFRSNTELARRYTRVIEANIEAGFARRLRLEELAGPNGRTWYLPHFLVTNPNKP